MTAVGRRGWRSRWSRIVAARYRNEVCDDLSLEYERRIRPARGRLYSALWLAAHLVRSSIASHAAEARRQAGEWRAFSLVTVVTNALRTLIRRPGYPALTTGILAAGIGVTSAIGLLFYRAVLRPVDVRDPHTLVALRNSVSYPALADLGQSGLFADYAGFMAYVEVSIGGANGSERVTPTFVTGNYFRTLGVDVARGRALNQDDDRRGAPLTAVISDRLWRSLFAADPAIVGRSVRINGRQVEVVGVAPSRFRGVMLLFTPELWLPASSITEVGTGFLPRMPLFDSREIVWLQAVARLAPGVTRTAANAAMAQKAAAADAAKGHSTVGAATPAEPPLAPIDAYAVGLDDGPALRRFMWLLAGAALCGLLVTWANAANLFVSSTLARSGEFGVRQALGASRRRIFVESMAETSIVAMLAGMAAVAVATGTLHLLSAFSLPGAVAVDGLALDVDWRVWLFTAAVAAASAVAIGLIPAWQAARASRLTGIDRARASARTAVRAVLIGVQVAASVAFVAGGAVFYRSIGHVLARPSALPVEQLAVADVQTSLERYGKAQTVALYDDAVRDLTRSGRVAGAVWASGNPLISRFGAPLELESAPTDPDQQPRNQHAEYVGPNFFHVLGVPMLKGRDIAAGDTATSPRVVVVNDAFARTYFPDRDTVGQRVRLIKSWRTLYGLSDDWAEIVGVAPELRGRAMAGGAAPALYFPYAQSTGLVSDDAMTLIARADTDVAAASAIAETMRRLAPRLPVTAKPLSVQERGPLLPQRFGMTLLGMFGAFSLALSTAGILGLCSFIVSHRRREIGIRLALGAGHGHLARIVLERMTLATLAGAASGTVVVLAASRTLASLTADASSPDAAVIGVATAIALAAAAGASALPLRRATRIDPVIVLRSE